MSRLLVLGRSTCVILAAVVGLGVTLGTAFYFIAGGSASWPVEVERTTYGWRISSPLEEQQQVRDLTEERLLWDNGAHLELLDLTTGKTTVMQAPGFDESGRETSVLMASLSPRYAVWTALEHGGRGESLIAFDLRSNSRQTLASRTHVDQVFAASKWIVWQQGREVICRDMDSGETRLVANSEGIRLIGSEDSLIAWMHVPGGDARRVHPTVWTYDLESGSTTHFPIEAPVASLIGAIVCGDKVVYQEEGDRSGGPLYVVTVRGVRRLVTNSAGMGEFAGDSHQLLWGVGRPGRQRFWRQGLNGGPKAIVR